MITDIDVVTGNYLRPDFLPKDKKYLLKYFKTPVQRAFLLYYLYGGSRSLFTEHTGFVTKARFWFSQVALLKRIIVKHGEAKNNFDLDNLEDLEKGKVRKSQI